MTDLLSLPDELLVDICSYLWTSDLLETSLTCKRLHGASISSLYDSPQCQVLGDNGSHASLLYAIADQPRLATRVRHLRITYVSINYDRSLPASQAHRNRRLAAVLKDSLEASNEWSRALEHCKIYSDELVAGLLMYYATHLETLMLGPNAYPHGLGWQEWCESFDDTGRFDPREWRPISLLPAILAVLPKLLRANETKPLDRLHTVILDSLPAEWEGCTHQIEYVEWTSRCWSDFFALPSLRFFAAYRMRCWHWVTPPQLSNVTTIKLIKCDIPTSIICNMLKSCRVVETFHWTNPGHGHYRHQRRETDYETIMPGLLNLAPTLKWLGLGSDCQNKDEHSQSNCLEDWSCLWSILPSMSKLQSLLMDQGGHALAISPVDCHQNLPSSLGRLIYKLDAVNAGRPQQTLVESVLKACQNIPILELQILVVKRPIRVNVILWKRIFPHLSFRIADIPEHSRPRQGESAPTGILLIRHKHDSFRCQADDEYEKLWMKAVNPYDGQNPQWRPHKCILNHQSECVCRKWDNRNYPLR